MACTPRLDRLTRGQQERPYDAISGAEAAEIIGVTELSVAGLVMKGIVPKAVKGAKRGLSRREVEAVSLMRFKPGHLCWVTTAEAAGILGVSQPRVRQLAVRGFLPVVDHEGRRFFRRAQLEVLANARRARRRE